jgi:hypothetical protein
MKKLDRLEAPKTKVVVRITLPNAKAYKNHEDEIKSLADRAGGLLAVKMT